MRKQTSWRAVLIAYAAGVVGAIQVGRVAPATNALHDDIGLNLATLGWAVSLITLASVLFGLAAGYLVALRGTRNVLIFGLTTLAAGTGLAAVSNSVTMLLLIRSLEGVGYLGIVVAAPTLIAQTSAAKDTPFTLALWGTFFTLGLSISAIGGGVLSESLGWRGWYMVNALLLACAIPLAYRTLPKEHKPDIIRAGTVIAKHLPPACWLLGGAFFEITLLTLALLSVLPSFLMENQGFSPVTAGGVTGIVALTSIGGSFAYGTLVPRIGLRSTTFAAVALLVVTAIPAFSLGLSWKLSILFTALAVFGTGILVAHVFASVPRLVNNPESIGPANGLIAQLGSIGALSGPPAVGYLVTAHGWLALSTLIILFSGFFLLVMAMAERTARAVVR